MTLEQEYTLSLYREIADIDPIHKISLVQHIQTRQLFVKKTLTYYHLDVMRRLQSSPVPGVPAIHALIENEDSLIVIEDYIHGETVRQLLDRRKTLSAAEGAALIRQLCRILRPLHAAEPPIVHRDIKPSNLIVSQDGVLYLVDFNAAKSPRASAARDTDLIGTHGYAAPEQYGFAPSAPTTDIYAIGILLNVMLTGELPNSQLADGPLREVIQTCTAMDPSQRYSSVDSLLSALDKPKSSQTVQKPKQPVSRWYPPGFRTKQWWKMLLAGGYYGVVTLFTALMEMTDLQGNPSHGLDLWANRAAFWLAMILPVLCLANYRNINRWLPWKSHPVLRWVPRILLAVLACLLPICLLVWAENFAIV
jgi:serine/threonine protein kinase